jgi:hypothetical protein
MMRNAFLLVSVTAALGLGACAQRPVDLAANPASDPSVQASATADIPSPAPKTVVPQLATLTVGEVDKRLAAAGLVPILRYEPGVISGLGTVVGTDPPAGAQVRAGDVVTVLIAGQPGPTLEDYIAAHRETFVGIGVDTNGVIVVAIHQQADLTKEVSELSRLAGGRSYRVLSCGRSFTDLQRVQLELARRDFVPGADKLAFGTAIDPLACAVRLTIELTDAEVAQLTQKYQGALVIQKGTARRGG